MYIIKIYHHWNSFLKAMIKTHSNSQRHYPDIKGKAIILQETCWFENETYFYNRKSKTNASDFLASVEHIEFPSIFISIYK